MKRQEGSALLMVLVLSIIALALMVSVVGLSSAQSRATYGLNNVIIGIYACEAGLETVTDQVNLSSYDAVGNEWLVANSSTGGTLVYDDLQIGNTLVDVTIEDLETGEYLVTSEGFVDGTHVRLTQTLRGRDTFARFLFFIDVDDVNFGASTVKGFVHSNKGINFYYGGAEFHNEVSAVQGFDYLAGADEDNTDFLGGSNPAADRINMPSTNEIATLSTEASGIFNVSNSNAEYSGLGNFDTEIELNGDQVTIRAVDFVTGDVLQEYTDSLPPDGLIYVDGDVTSIQGDVAGQVTVAAMGDVDVTDKIRYVDEEGDPAYHLVDADGNEVVDTGVGVVWDGVDYIYEPNDDYDPATPSSLGILASQDVTVAEEAPYNMELHAAIYSAVGRWSCDLSSEKGNLRTVGSMVMQRAGWRYNSSGDGYSLSGVYNYDDDLFNSPPPHYLELDKPVFGPKFKE